MKVKVFAQAGPIIARANVVNFAASGCDPIQLLERLFDGYLVDDFCGVDSICRRDRADILRVRV